jgi:hypothetical protein
MDPLADLIKGIALGQFGAILSAIAALGTAAFGLVDASKAFGGGISNVGYGFIASALYPYEAALRVINERDPYAVPKANWLNGMDKAEQKAIARNLIRLGFTFTTASAIAPFVLPDNAEALSTIALKMESGATPTEPELAILARFDAIIDARLDAAFERADQKYRNISRATAAATSVVLAVLGAMLVYGTVQWKIIFLGLIVGVIAVPIAPIAKDLSSGISTAIATFKTIKQ